MADITYVDSCVFLSFLKNEAGRADIVQTCFANAQDGMLGAQLATSVLTIAEVAYILDENNQVVGNLDRIDKLWSDLPILLIEVNRAHANIARDFVRSRVRGGLSGGRNRAADMLHLATAIALGATTFWTYNIKDFSTYGVHGLKIAEPTPGQLRLDS